MCTYIFVYTSELNIFIFFVQTNGDTPLHIAVRRKYFKMVELLIERGNLDPDKVNKVYMLCNIVSVIHQIQECTMSTHIISLLFLMF